MSVFVTDKRLLPYDVHRGLLSTPPRTDVLRYTLESLAVLPIKKACLYIEFDNNYKGHDLSYIDKLFDAEIHTKRITHQKDWQRVIDQMPDEFIWYCGNEDHIFLDRDLNMINDVIANMEVDDLCAFYYSHFPELTNSIRKGMGKNVVELFKNYAKYYIHNDEPGGPGGSDSVQIMSKKLLNSFFNIRNYGDKFIFRTDGLESPNANLYIPLREACRHFDGYGHWNSSPHASSPGRCNFNFCPAIDIPPGFFEKEIKIRFFFDDNLPGWVNINPLKTDFTHTNIDGTDYKWIVKDIPLFWKDKIAEIKVNPHTDEALMTQKRNEAFLQLMQSQLNHPLFRKASTPEKDKQLFDTALSCFIQC